MEVTGWTNVTRAILAGKVVCLQEDANLFSPEGASWCTNIWVLGTSGLVRIIENYPPAKN